MGASSFTAPISRFPKVVFMCSTRRKETSTPSEQSRLAPYVIIVMRLAILVDVIAIAAGVAIILPTADDEAGYAADHGAHCRACTSADARKDGAGQRARASAGRRAGRAGCNGVVILRCRRTAA